MMTATMAAAKDTNQLMLTNANAKNNNNTKNNYNNNNTIHTINTNITANVSNGYPLGRQPFYQHATTTTSKLITPTITTAATTTATIDSAINIGLTHHAHAHNRKQRANGSGELKEMLQRDEMSAQRVIANGADVVVVVDMEDAIEYDEGNVDGNDYMYRGGESVRAVTPIVKTGVPAAAPTPSGLPADANFAVKSTRTRLGMPLVGAALKIDYENECVNAIEDDDDGDDDDDDASDSFGSMETLSDNVGVWVDGEKHWVAGVDANTTCADLIGALLSYQQAQQVEVKQQQQADNLHNHHQRQHHRQYQQQQQQQQHQHMFNNNNSKKNECKHNSKSTNSSCDNNNITTNTPINQSTLIKTSTNTKENGGGIDSSLLPSSVELPIVGGLPSSTNDTVAPVMALTVPASGNDVSFSIANNRLLHAYEYVIVKQHRHYEEYLDGNAKVFDILPVANDGAARKECELLLRRLSPAAKINCHNNNNITAYTTLPPSTMQQRPSSPSLQLNTQVSSLLSTDKDSGMGSPVGSSRSARLRRRKYKSAAATVSWLAQANTLHPRVSQRAVAAFTGLSNALNNGAHNGNSSNSSVGIGVGVSVDKQIPSLIEHVLGEDGSELAHALDGLGGGVGVVGGGSANERLLKIILAQDETIHRQLVLLREKERQISKIEEEKHRVRERELGKNYLLETYLNGLDEVAVGSNNSEACTDVVLPDSSLNVFNDARHADTAIVGHVDHFDGGNDDVEIYIDEPYQRDGHTTTAKTTQNNNNTDARHSKKMKGDFTGGGGGFAVEKNTTNEPTTTVNRQQQGNEKEIEAQLFWLEKIYALNKQLQREEETLLKLHAKIRKHQVKRAYQTKREVLQQIEKLDAELTLQCCDIRAVENKLHNSNEQLKQKLSVLERLSQEFIETMSDDDGGGEGDEERRESAAVQRVKSEDNADVLTIGAYGQRTVNRIPDIIENDKHILATTTTIRTATSTREELTTRQHTKQLSDVALSLQQSYQTAKTCGEQAAEREGEGEGGEGGGDGVTANSYLPHATQAGMGGDDLHGNLNESSEDANVRLLQCNLTRKLTHNTTTTTANAIIDEATTKQCGRVAASHATVAMTATSCSASMSNVMMRTTIATTTTVVTTTTPSTRTTTSTGATFACNNLQPTNSIHLQQTQQIQQQQQNVQQQHLHLANITNGVCNKYNNNNCNNNAHQCGAVANDVLIDDATLLATTTMTATTFVGGTTQSNYPISCINHAAMHATSQHLTKQIVVVGAADVDAQASRKLAMSEQTLPPAGATLSSIACLTTTATATSSSSSATTNVAINQQQQQQQQHWQPINNDKHYANQTNMQILQQQTCLPKSLNQRLLPTPKIIPQTSSAAVTALTAPSASATSLHSLATHDIYCSSSSSALRPTTPAVAPLLASPVTVPTLTPTVAVPLAVPAQRSNGFDITQLGTLV